MLSQINVFLFFITTWKRRGDFHLGQSLNPEPGSGFSVILQLGQAYEYISNQYHNLSFLWSNAATHSCCWSTWRAVWSWDGKYQCLMSIFIHANNTFIRWLPHPPSSQNSPSWNPYSVFSCRPTLWAYSYWDAIWKYHYHWPRMGSW